MADNNQPLYKILETEKPNKKGVLMIIYIYANTFEKNQKWQLNERS